MTTDTLMSQSSHSFYDKFKRAKAGLPQKEPKLKQLEKEPAQQQTFLGPKWGDHKPAVAPKRPRKSPRVQMPHGMSRADIIRANWKPTPRYPTYDDYLAAKKQRNDAQSRQSDPQWRAARDRDEVQKAMNGPHTHFWERNW